MAKLTEMTVAAFLDALAAGQSTPGGGGAAALTGSEAAALVSMVLNFTVGRKKYASLEEEMRGYLARSETLRRELLDLVQADAAAFDAVSACYDMPRGTEAEKAARTAALQEALKQATYVPYTVAGKCLAVLHLAEPVSAKGNSNVVSDAVAAIYLARAGLLSAITNVNINLKFIKDDGFLAEWSARRDHLLAEAEAAYRAAAVACEKTLGINV